MSVNSALMKGLYDMNVIKKEDNTHATFISEDNDIIIDMDRSVRKVFFSENNGFDYFCTLTFKNNLGVVLKQIVISELDVSILIDNIYNLLEGRMNEVYVHFNSYDSSCIDIAIKIETNANMVQQSYYQTFTLYNYINQQLIPILNFNIIDNIVEFVELLYSTFLIDLDKYTAQNPYELLQY